MDQQNQSGVPGPAGRKLHIAHRRSPSELTPLMSMFPLQLLLRSLFPAELQIANNRRNSGTIGDSATNRDASATATANRSHTSTVCQYGTIATTTTWPSFRFQSLSTRWRCAHGRRLPTTTRCFSVSSSSPAAATATARDPRKPFESAFAPP